jgi:hypothetical protein
MTILKVDDETFSIIMLALNECGYDLDGLEIEIYDEVCEEKDPEELTLDFETFPSTKKKLKDEKCKLKSRLD